MKNIIATILLVFIVATVAVGQEIEFNSETVDYGVIEHNADGNRYFVFKNTGKDPLIITNAKGSCGCTVPTYPREPIAPGATDTVKVRYATNRIGRFTKTVTITSNAKTAPTKVLKITGEVLPDAAAPANEGAGQGGHEGHNH